MDYEVLHKSISIKVGEQHEIVEKNSDRRIVRLWKCVNFIVVAHTCPSYLIHDMQWYVVVQIYTLFPHKWSLYGAQLVFSGVLSVVGEICRALVLRSSDGYPTATTWYVIGFIIA